MKNRLKEIRMKEHMMTQKDFAEKVLEIDYRQYNRYENGICPSLEVAIKISDKLNKSVKEIFFLAN